MPLAAGVEIWPFSLNMWFTHLTGFSITGIPIHYIELSDGQSCNVGGYLLALDKSNYSSHTVVFFFHSLWENFWGKSRSLIVCRLIYSNDQFQTWLYLIVSGKIFPGAMSSLVKLCRPATIFQKSLDHQRFDLAHLICADLSSLCKAKASAVQPTNEASQLCFELHFSEALP